MCLYLAFLALAPYRQPARRTTPPRTCHVCGDKLIGPGSTSLCEPCAELARRLDPPSDIFKERSQ